MVQKTARSTKLLALQLLTLPPELMIAIVSRHKEKFQLITLN